MKLIALPGVFRPRSDSWLLARALEHEVDRDASVLDVCTGSGVLAVTAARVGAADVTAIDISRRAVMSARLNARLNGVRMRALRGDLFEPVGGRRFDTIVSNPPYVPSRDDRLPRRGPSRAWEGGLDGRAVLDRICAQAPSHLKPGGSLLLVHSSVTGIEQTKRQLSERGLAIDIVVRHQGPLGPLLAERAHTLATRGLLPHGNQEELLVIRATVPPAGPEPQRAPPRPERAPPPWPEPERAKTEPPARPEPERAKIMPPARSEPEAAKTKRGQDAAGPAKRAYAPGT